MAITCKKRVSLTIHWNLFPLNSTARRRAVGSGVGSRSLQGHVEGRRSGHLPLSWGEGLSRRTARRLEVPARNWRAGMTLTTRCAGTGIKAAPYRQDISSYCSSRDGSIPRQQTADGRQHTADNAAATTATAGTLLGGGGGLSAASDGDSALLL